MKDPWYSTFMTAKYEYSTQNSFSVKPEFAESVDSHPGCRYSGHVSTK